MAFGITSTGFSLKRVADIRDEIKATVRSTFGNSANLDDRAPLGQLIGIFAEREALVWELFETLYNNLNPDGAEGVPLDNIVAFTGTVRKAATKSIGTVTLFGTVSTVIPASSIISVAGNPVAKFLTNADATIAAGVNEIQTITFSAVPDAGSFTLNFDGEITDPIDWNDVAADVETALENLVNISSVTVTGNFTSGFVITFDGSDGSKPQVALEVGSNSLSTKEKTGITCVADVAGSLDGKYFIIYDQNGSVGVWFDIDNNGTSIPGGASAANRAIKVTGANTGATASQVATALRAALIADSKFTSSTVLTTVVTAINTDAGAMTDAVDGNTGFGFSVTKQGSDAGDVDLTFVETTPGALPQVSVGVTAQIAGATAAPSGSLTVIETPVTNWDSSSNSLDITIGTDTESDVDLIQRRRRELSISGRATVNAILAAILALDEVDNAIVFENETNVVDPDGRPANSVEVVVQGGDDADIAAALFDVVAAGIKAYGSTIVSVDDSQGFAHDIGFSRPTSVPIYIEIDIVKDPNTFPVDGAAQIKAAIIAAGDALGIGVDVIVIPRIICAIDTVDGVLNVEVRISTAAIPVSGSTSFTAVSDAGEMEIQKTSHGRILGDRLTFGTSGTLPTGLTTSDVFTIVEVVDANNFKVSTDRVSDPLPFVSAGSGTHTYTFGGFDANIAIDPQEIADFDTSRTTVTIL